MNAFYVFILRALLGAFFAVILSRFFFPGANISYVAGFAIFLVGMAYVAEYLRNRKSK